MLGLVVIVLALFQASLEQGSTAAPGENDFMPSIPGMLFQPNFKTYSGYLNANSNGTWKLHYMLTESRINPDQAPLLFWFNGGPGCSSFSGSFEELGPFYIYKDGKSIYENVYSWNYQANVLYLESPVGTGFSYSTDDPHYHKADDDQSLEQNLHALKDFFSRVMPKYQNRTFFLSGESYAGLYLPMLGAAITNGTLDGSFPNKNFAGIAIGNGFMDVPGLTNSLILWSNYHGRISLENWERLKKPDCCNTTSDIDSCDWTQNLESQNRIDFVGKNTPCGNILDDIINATGLYPALDPYNYYEDCYVGSQITWFAKPRRHYKGVRDETNDPNYFQNPANLINRDSTDNMWGYPCWQEDYVFTYFNDPNVQTAFHIDQKWMQAKINFSDCNGDLYNQYINKYSTMDQFFDTILNNIENPKYPVKNFRILIYNGDVDTVCNFLGDSKFIKKVSDRNGFTSNNRTRWWYRSNIAGFYQTYSSKSSGTTIDVLTIKGAGHMVPMDRAGPSQQMITNFMLYNGSIVDYSYNKDIIEDPNPIPLLNNSSPTTPLPNNSSTGENDFMPSIPGMLFQPNFKTYSGYLNANSNGTWKLHYMLTESRINPDQAPLLFWFNGGPGCSSFSGSFEELGPFYIYKDGKSIYENVYSWNYQANVLYLESPVGTGFSYSTDDPHYHKADDDQSLEQNLHALKDFFSRVMPKYQNRTFFLSGESYAGLYLPMLGAAITNGTLDGSFPNKNFAGIAIGNGFMDVPGLTNSLILWSNYHGRISLENWERLKKPDCCNTTSDIDSCDWTQNLESQNRIDFVGKNTPCGNILDDIINATGLYPALDPYNYYEDCYVGSQITWFAKPRRHYKGVRDETNDPNYFQNPANLINRDSTDNMWGYPCWQEDYVFTYFNDPNVQTAFHIDQKWMQAKINFSDCNGDLYNQYINKYSTMDQFFDTILNNIENPKYPVKNFRILIYNGDVDTVCNFLGDSKFIKKVSDRNGFTSNNRTRWWYRSNIAGFYQTYSSKSSRTTIDVLTVKGAGHMVPMDRAGPSQQMITNFMLYNGSIVDYSYNKDINEDPNPIPLLNNSSPTTSLPNNNSPPTTPLPNNNSSPTTLLPNNNSSPTTLLPNNNSSPTTLLPNNSSPTQPQPTGAGISQKPLVVTIIIALFFILFY